MEYLAITSKGEALDRKQLDGLTKMSLNMYLEKRSDLPCPHDLLIHLEQYEEWGREKFIEFCENFRGPQNIELRKSLKQFNYALESFLCSVENLLEDK